MKQFFAVVASLALVFSAQAHPRSSDVFVSGVIGFTTGLILGSSSQPSLPSPQVVVQYPAYVQPQSQVVVVQPQVVPPTPVVVVHPHSRSVYHLPPPPPPRVSFPPPPQFHRHHHRPAHPGHGRPPRK